jgi:hypothetical protein
LRRAQNALEGDRVVGEILRPSSLEEVSAAVAGQESLCLRGLSTRPEWSTRARGHVLDMSAYTGILDFSPDDQVVAVKAGTPIAELDAELRNVGQCLPLVQWPDTGSLHGSVGGEVSLNLPHLLEGQCGSWRDWVLGMTLVLAEGEVAKSGSHAVKNVAGYDIHKMLIGSRGSLAVIAEVILRTFPVKSLPAHTASLEPGAGPGRIWIQRVLRSDFACASETRGGIDDPETSTLYRWIDSGSSLPRFHGDWVLDPAQPFKEIVRASKYMLRTKQVFDPQGKFPPHSAG